MTNYVVKGDKQLPLNRIFRQLRIKPEEFELAPQRFSEIRFPNRRLRFNNNIALLTGEVAEQFPSQADGFRRMLEAIPSYDKLGSGALAGSARKFLGDYFSEQTLIEMLLCPVMYYGSATCDDMNFEQFCIMFRSLFFEGFARPRTGVRQVISTLLRKYKANRGELRMKCGVRKLETSGARIDAIELDHGERVTADVILSSAGSAETLQLCSGRNASGEPQAIQNAGVMTFTESLSVLDCFPAEIGHETTIAFFNNSDVFRYRPSADFVDVSSGVICCPNNFEQSEALDEGLVRVTNIASYDLWKALPGDAYAAKKNECYQRSVAEAVKFMPDFRGRVKFVDSFTPLTIRRFTGHFNGAVYGAPQKHAAGRTPFSNLFLCGTDQGFLGIVGAMVSGIAMANAHVLAKSAQHK
jgi:phytoene dehydrogenase-like protein